MPSPIVIYEYDPEWPSRYVEERDQILAVIGKYITAIEHIGSTSVPGLGSKPIIDLLAGVAHLDEVQACIAPLETIGYQYMPSYERFMPERRYFLKGTLDHQIAHLHIFEATDFVNRHELVFRDYLRAHLDTAREYQDLKRQLAARYGSDRDSYTQAKTDFIRSVVRRALAEKGE